MRGHGCFHDDAEVGRAVYEWMLDNHIKSKELAQMLGISTTTLNDRFNGKSPFSRSEIAILSRKMRVSVAFFFTMGEAYDPEMERDGLDETVEEIRRVNNISLRRSLSSTVIEQGKIAKQMNTFKATRT